MGITIHGNWKDAKHWDMGYSSFYRLRKDIAYMVSEEYGDHYKNIRLACAKLIDVKEYDIETERLIKKYHCKKRFLYFLYQSDIGGKLSPFKCKAVYDMIEKSNCMNNKTLYGYSAYPENCMKMSDFANLLLECFNRRKALVWY